MRTTQKFLTQASPEIIWQILEDVENWPQWTPTMLKVKPLGDSGLKVGAKYEVTQPKLRPAMYEVIECIPTRAFTWVQKMPGGALIADHRIVPIGSASEVELSFRSEGWLGNLIGRFFSKMITEYVATEARSLKYRCEAVAAKRTETAQGEKMFSGL